MAPHTHSKKNLAFVFGVTPDMAFATGVAIIALQRHITTSDYDVVIISEGLREQDKTLLASLHNVRFLDYEPTILDRNALPPEHPYFFIYRFEIFKLLAQYKTAIWLDSDIVIQGDLSPLTTYGPFAIAQCAGGFTKEKGHVYTCRRNFINPVEGYDMDAPLYNSGVLVFQDSLPRPNALYAWCMNKYLELRSNLFHTDQAIFNLFIQEFPDLAGSFPATSFNCYPLHPAANGAHIVHCFGNQKTWNNTLLELSYPEWARDYDLWKKLGGSAYEGPVRNTQLRGFSTYGLLSALLDKLEQGQTS